MNYSTLTIPTPKCCEQCLCMGGIAISCVICRATGRIIRNPFEKMGDCPLKPVGDRYEEDRDRP